MMVGQRRRLLDYLKRKKQGATSSWSSGWACGASRRPMRSQRASLPSVRSGDAPGNGAAGSDRRKNTMFKEFRKEITGAAAGWFWRPARSPARPMAPCSRRWARPGPVHRRLREDGEGRPGLLPAVGQLPGKELRRRQDPGRLLQARGPAGRERDSDLAPDRPADPAAVPQGLPQRDPDHLHRAGARPGERSRHPRR